MHLKFSIFLARFSNIHPQRRVMTKITVPAIKSYKNKESFSAYTAYDFTIAQILNEAEVAIILVGDSLANIIQGEKNTLSVTLEQMVYHSRCVAKACTKSLLVTDLPFLTYQESNEVALRNAGKVIQEGQAEAVKMEGGVNIQSRIKFLTQFDIPVMGHVGLTPQSFHALGGHKKQGGKNSVFSENKIMEDALAVEEAGAFSIVLECIPEELAQAITKKLTIPTIGIGSGQYCDAEVFVTPDILGLTPKQPSFVKQRLNLREDILSVIKNIKN